MALTTMRERKDGGRDGETVTRGQEESTRFLNGK